VKYRPDTEGFSSATYTYMPDLENSSTLPPLQSMIFIYSGILVTVQIYSQTLAVDRFSEPRRHCSPFPASKLCPDLMLTNENLLYINSSPFPSEDARFPGWVGPPTTPPLIFRSPPSFVNPPSRSFQHTPLQNKNRVQLVIPTASANHMRYGKSITARGRLP